MNLTDDANRFKEYAKTKHKDIFSKIDVSRDSYWEENDNTKGIIQYKFDSPVELMNILSDYLDDDQAVKIMVSSAYKLKNTAPVVKESISSQGDKSCQLPEFVYAF